MRGAAASAAAARRVIATRRNAHYGGFTDCLFPIHEQKSKDQLIALKDRRRPFGLCTHFAAQ
jgi:hypothetical protein